MSSSQQLQQSQSPSIAEVVPAPPLLPLPPLPRDWLGRQAEAITAPPLPRVWLEQELQATRQANRIQSDGEDDEAQQEVQRQAPIDALLAELTEIQQRQQVIPASYSHRHEHFVTTMQEEDSDDSDDDNDNDQMDMDDLLLMELEELLEPYIKAKQ